MLNKQTQIGVWDKIIRDDICEDLIAYYEEFHKNYEHYVMDRSSLDGATDTAVSASIVDPYVRDSSLRITRILPDILGPIFRECVKEYTKTFQLLEKFPGLSIYDGKIQKTSPGDGYHNWHCESTKHDYRFRICAFTLYLNDVEEGGETEFLNQHERVSPEAGRVAIWPAYFTHPHRGNPPLSGDKYIYTGWIESI